RFLDVFEAVNRDVPFNGLRWFFDHAETVTERNLERVKALGGGIAVQHRMAYQGEYFIDRYGAEAAGHTPPIAKMLRMGLPVGADGGGRQGRVRGGRVRQPRPAAAARDARLVAGKGLRWLPPNRATSPRQHSRPRLRPRRTRTVAPLARLDAAGQARAVVGAG